MAKPIKSICITGAKIEQQSFVVYTIKIQYLDDEIVRIERRFRQFVALDKLIKRYNKTTPAQLPSKAMVGNLNPAFVQSRIEDLQKYLHDIAADTRVCGSPPFISFRDPTRNTMDKIEDLFDAVDRDNLDSLTFMLDACTQESLDLIKINHRTTWAGCGSRLAIVAAGATAVVAPATLAAGAATVAGCTAVAAKTVGVVGAATGAAAGCYLSDNRPVTCAAAGALLGGSAGFLGTYLGVASSVPAAVNSAIGYSALSPLHYAILRNRPSAVRLLVERRANLSATCTCAGASGWTPLHLAAHVDNAAALQALLACPDGGRQLRAQDSFGRTPRAVACGVRAALMLIELDPAAVEPPVTAAAAAAAAAAGSPETEGYV